MPVDAQAVGHVVEDRFGKRIGLLEHHADPAAQLGDVLRQDILAIQGNFALQARVAERFVHAVQRAQQRGFAAAGRPDQRRDLVGGHVHGDVVQRLVLAVVKIQLA